MSKSSPPPQFRQLKFQQMEARPPLRLWKNTSTIFGVRSNAW